MASNGHADILGCSSEPCDNIPRSPPLVGEPIVRCEPTFGDTMPRCEPTFGDTMPRTHLSSLSKKRTRDGFVRPRVTCAIFVSCACSFFILATCVLAVVPTAKGCEDKVDNCDGAATGDQFRGEYNSYVASYQHLFAAQMSRTWAAAFLTIVSYFSVILSLVTATVVVTFVPHKVPDDFESNPTVGNVCQDVYKPAGRMFSVLLFIAGSVSMASKYTLHIYPNWCPLATRSTFYLTALQNHYERQMRLAWVTFPNIGLMYSAALPSLSNRMGTNVIMAMVHNIAGPASLCFILVMETWQLSYGENAFSYFSCDEVCACYSGKITPVQRLRVFVVCCTWFAALSWCTIQAYLISDKLFKLPVRRSYGLALVSFYSEIAVFALVFALPAIQACGLFFRRRERIPSLLQRYEFRGR
eukprot:TRINITY_DN7026_c0_g1_i1.p1 TRINITY_DN7026_c0_g1~~TRINITY_DN7026_c0_g1_i1.p1  ORF type:complete len:431 (+),score=16.95 TRINITY_DN7026_c0_g1_i1:56-1294(+)